MKDFLAVRNLSVSYNSFKALHSIDFSVPKGTIYTLLGANGAGKTTTLRAISRLGVAVSGEILLNGERIDGLRPAEIVRKGVAHVPDGRGTFLELSVADNLRIGGYQRRDTAALAESTETLYGYFPRLRERRKQQAGTLSGGEQQMLAIARALMSDPKLLLLDEPSFGLAPKIVREIFEILGRLNSESGMTVLLVEQNAALGLKLSDHACVLESGRVVLEGPADSIARDATVRRAYLGE